jgi:hypothetical protein
VENASVNIRLYQPGDDENIVKLLQKTFPKWDNFPDPLNVWRWKYLNMPLRSIVVVAVMDDKIVGCDHSIIFNAKIGSESTVICYTDDVAVDIDFRKLGIWSKMSHYKDEMNNTTNYEYATTINPIVKNSWIRRGFIAFPFTVTRMVRIKDVNLHLRMRPMENSLLVKWGYSGLKLLNLIMHYSSSLVDYRDNFKIVEITKFDDSIDTFWDKIKDDYNFILEKKHIYLNWRYFDPRGTHHLIMQVMYGGEILGFAAIAIREEGKYAEGYIEDLITLPKRLDVADALLDHICKHFDMLGINSVYYQVVEKHPYQNLSNKYGFINSQSKPNIYLKNKRASTLSDWDQFLRKTSPSQVYFDYAETI